MIVNCHQLGLDWERASLSDYLEAIDASAPADGKAPIDTEGLQRFVAAHTLQ